MIPMKRFRLSRRACLRGAGVAIALPWLEIMEPPLARAQALNPIRFLSVYAPNGMLMPKWTPVDTGMNYTTPELLASLDPYKADFNVLTGLGNYTASLGNIFGGSHTRACGGSMISSQGKAMATPAPRRQARRDRRNRFMGLGGLRGAGGHGRATGYELDQLGHQRTGTGEVDAELVDQGAIVVSRVTTEGKGQDLLGDTGRETCVGRDGLGELGGAVEGHVRELSLIHI